MLKVAVVGATGYTGEEIVKLLLNHPKIQITSLSAMVDKAAKYSEFFPYFEDKIDLICDNLDIDDVAKKAELVFLALPHTVSMRFAPKFLEKGLKVIDLSADYRISDAEVYKNYYKTEHVDKANLKSAVYGLPEIYRDAVKKAKLLANPGCYPTGILLSCAPFLKKGIVDRIIVDAKSGLSGAGRKPSIELSFCEVNENTKTYKIGTHQHMSEIQQECDNFAGENVNVFFTPSVVPMTRGILSNIYMLLNKPLTNDEAYEILEGAYKGEPFLKILKPPRLPAIKDVVYTNNCFVGANAFPKSSMIVLVAAIDNLIKGASGQAIQNMNLMSNISETEGLL